MRLVQDSHRNWSFRFTLQYKLNSETEQQVCLLKLYLVHEQEKHIV